MGPDRPHPEKTAPSPHFLPGRRAAPGALETLDEVLPGVLHRPRGPFVRVPGAFYQHRFAGARLATPGVWVRLRSAEETLVARSLTTPFRLHYEHCRALELAGQVQECTDHLQHPEVLLMEFFESYHQIERTWSPDQELRPPEGDVLVLEPFHESLEISIEGGDCEPERLVCLSGSMSPIPDELHPAISHRGLDYVGLLPGPPPHLVLGVAQASKEETNVDE